jgi:hypothetical protein
MRLASMSTSLVPVTLMCFIVAGGARGAALPRLPFERYTLANGLQVILNVDDGLPVVRVDVRYWTGAKDDPPGREGLAHLVEHLMFLGTKHVPRGEFWRIVGGWRGSRGRHRRVRWARARRRAHRLDQAPAGARPRGGGEDHR